MSVVIFDDMLGARNSSQADEVFTRGKHENWDVYYLRLSSFRLSRQSIRNNSDRIKMFKQTLRDVDNVIKDISGYDVSR